MDIKDFTEVIVDNENTVGQVHLGLPIAIEVATHEVIEPDLNEIHQAEWVDIQWLKGNVHLFENWSKMLIEKL